MAFEADYRDRLLHTEALVRDPLGPLLSTRAELGFETRLFGEGAAAVGATIGDGHFEIQGSSTVKAGYITAWLRYKLEDDQSARAAFVGSSPELNTNPGWAWQMQKNLR
jgi:hypothetical protein